MSTTQDDLDPNYVGFEFIKEGADWLAIFNPKVPRQMDVKLVTKFVHDKVVCSVKYSPCGKRLAVGSDGSILLYNLSSGKKVGALLDKAGDGRNYVRAVAFSPDSKFLASGSEDKLIRIWSIDLMTQLQTLDAHHGEIYGLEFSSDGQLPVSASGDRTVRVWDVSLPSEKQTTIIQTHCRVLTVKESGKSDVAFTSLTISTDSRYVAAGSLDGITRIWDLTAIPESAEELDGARLVDRLKGHQKSVYSVKFVSGLSARRNGESLVSGSLDQTLKRWEIGPFDEDDGVRGASPTGEGAGENGSVCVKTLKGHKDYILATSVVREGQNYRVVSASRDGTVRVWDLKTGVVQFMIQGHKNTVTSVDFSPDGNQLATGSGDCEVRLWSYTLL